MLTDKSSTSPSTLIGEIGVLSHSNLIRVEQVVPMIKGTYGGIVYKRYVHELKSWGMFFEDIAKGIRTSDIRYTGDGRRFKIGDVLYLREFDPVRGTYTGRVQTVEVTYIQSNKSNPCAISREALHDDYAVLSIRKL